jgi:acyl-CoA synthetase (AMP-forming)/AMP-acid ligase II
MGSPIRAIAPGEKVAILSGNDPVGFACVFGISRAGTVWCPINPRSPTIQRSADGTSSRSFRTHFNFVTPDLWKVSPG